MLFFQSEKEKGVFAIRQPRCDVIFTPLLQFPQEPSAQDDAEENGPCKGGAGGVLSITLSSMCPAEENADFI